MWMREFLLYSHKHMRGIIWELGKHEFSKDFLFIYVVFGLRASFELVFYAALWSASRNTHHPRSALISAQS